MNKVLHVALCDDEEYIHETIGKVIKEYGEERKSELKVLHFFSGKDLLESKEEMHILLLDIDMPYIDGIEAAFCLKEKGKECKIIMLTSKQERFKEAFKIGAYRFVTKPVDIEELKEALDNTREILLGYNQIEVKFEHTRCKILQSNIDYIEACRDFVKIYVGKNICQSERTLKSWKEELDNRLFIECHKSYIVNLKSVAKVKRNTLVLENGKEIPIARRRKKDVLQTFIEYDTKKN